MSEIRDSLGLENVGNVKRNSDVVAPVAGTVTKILVNTTDAVEEGQPLVVIE